MDEIKKVISIDTSQAVSSLDKLKNATDDSGQSFKSMREYKEYIDSLRASLAGLEAGSEEYSKVAKEVGAAQEKYNKILADTKSSNSAVEGSYNALSKQLSELKKAWKETADEGERSKIGAQILQVNDKLKELDASVGNYQRNVGNYENAFTQGLSNIGKQASLLNSPLKAAGAGVKALGNSLKALILNPVGATIMAIVAAVKLLQKGFAGSEEASNKLKRAFSALEPITNGISNTLTSIANVVGSIAEKAIPSLVKGATTASIKIAEVLNKFGLLSDEKLKAFKDSVAAQEKSVSITQSLADREIKLTEKRRKSLVDNAKLEMEISELKAKAADKDKYSAEERQKFLEDAIAKERLINKTRLDIAQEEFNILSERSKLADNTAEDNEKLAAAEANLYNVRKEYYEKERSLTKMLTAANKEQSELDNKALEATAKRREEIVKQVETDLKKIEDINTRATDSLLSNKDRELVELARRYEEETRLFEEYGISTTALDEEYTDKRNEIEKKYQEERSNRFEERKKQVDEEAALEIYLENARKPKNYKEQFELQNALYEAEKKRLENKKSIIEEELALEDLIPERKRQLQNELLQINADLEENEENHKEKTKELITQQVGIYAQAAQSIGGMFDTIAGMMEDDIKRKVKNGEITEEQAEKEFERVKAMQLASTWITTLAGISNAIAQAMLLPWPTNLIVGAINAATVLTTGIAQTTKIKQTKFGSSVGGSGGAAAPTAATASYTPQYTSNITGASEIENLQNAVSSGVGTGVQDMRVYVVESDIREAGIKAEIRNSETTF